MQGRLDLRPTDLAPPQAPDQIELPIDFQPGLGDVDSLGVLASYSVATAGGLALFFFLLRGRRREDAGLPPSWATAIPPGQGSAAVFASVQATAAVSMPAALPDTAEAVDAPRTSRLTPVRETIPPLDYDLLRDTDEPAGPAAHEAGMPRWLRPSVRVARFGGEPTRRRDWGD